MSDTESIKGVVSGVVEWTKGTGREIGGVVAAAGVGNPGKVCNALWRPLWYADADWR